MPRVRIDVSMSPEINLVLGKIGAFTLFSGMGLLSMVCLSMWQTKHLRLDRHTEQLVLQSIPIVALPAVVPACLSDIAFRWTNFTENPLRFGMTFYGWLFGCLAGWTLYAALTNQRTWFLLDFFAPSLALAQAIGRIGCFLGGCCYGRPSSRGMGVCFPEGSLPWMRYGDQTLYPVQLLESFWLFSVFAVLLLVIHFRYRACCYFVLMGMGRFLCEFLRGDDRGTIFGIGQLSPAQFMSILLALCGAIAILSSMRKHKFGKGSANQEARTRRGTAHHGFRFRIRAGRFL